MTAVMRAAEARRMASMITRSSIRCSFTGGEVGWRTKTSSPRTLSSMLMRTSPSAKRERVISPRGTSRESQTSWASAGLPAPVNTFNVRPLTVPSPADLARPDHARGHADDDGAGGHVLRHHRPRAGGGALADPQRGHEHRVAAGERFVFDDRGPLLAGAVAQVAGNRPRADVHSLADGGVAEIGLVVHLAAVADGAVLHLGEVADLHAPADARSRPEVAVGTDAAPLAQRRLHHRRRHDGRAVTDRGIHQAGVRADHAAAPDARRALPCTAGLGAR